jgi:hypothetical protein
MLAIIGAESFGCYPKIEIKIYKTISLLVLYGCETWSLTSREERRLRIFENWVLLRVFRPRRNEGTREWRKLHDLYCSPTIIRVIKSRRMRWTGHVTRVGERRHAYRVLVGNLKKYDHLEDSVL